MNSILPLIRITELQRSPAAALASVKDYAIVQSHGHDRAFILHPRLGKILMESGMFDMLRQKCAEEEAADVATLTQSDKSVADELKKMIGPVLRELSKK
jgi:hypothetical protein